MKVRKLSIIGLLLILSIPASCELFKAGGFTSHDLTHHVIRQIAMDKILSQGQFPPRWVDYLNRGYGYPLFIFNYPLSPFYGEFFHLLGLNYLYSVKAVLISTFFIASVGMFLFLRELFGDLPALFGALTYLYAPIRFLNTYVSAAVGSALGLALVPWVFFWMVRVRKNPTLSNMLLGGVSLALLILSHNVTTFIFVIPLIIFAFMQIFLTKFNNKVILKLAGMYILGLGLSSFFWIPSVFEKNYIRYDSLLRYFYQDQFPSLMDLVRSPWGYGLSHPGQPGGTSYEIGIVQLLIIIILIIYLLTKKFDQKIKGDRMLYSWYAVGFFLISVVLMLKFSKPFWENLPFLYLVQFPARFSALSVFSVSLIAPIILEKLPKQGFFLTLGVMILLYASRNHWHINQVFDPGEGYYLSQKTTSTSFDEDFPIWVKKLPDKVAFGKYEFLSGNGSIQVLTDQATYTKVLIDVSQPSKLQFNQVYFPGWKINFNPAARVNYPDESRGYGLPTFNLAEGKYLVTASFENTITRDIADKISQVSVASLLGLILYSF